MPTRVKDLPASQRPRERLIRLGPEALSDTELLALLIGSGRPGASAIELAAAVVAQFDGLDGMRGAAAVDLTNRAGLGPAAAARIVAGFALARRSAGKAIAVVSCAKDVVALVAPTLAYAERERVMLVVMDAGNRVRHVEEIARAGVHGAPLPVREALAVALRHDGVSVAVAHNHPGGSLTASPADVRATRALKRGADSVGVRLLDHIVIAGDRWAGILDTCLGAGSDRAAGGEVGG